MAQHLEALAKANDRRRRRAADKREIKEGGEAIVPFVLRTLPDHWLNATAGELLMSMRGVGTQRANRLLRTLGASVGTPLRVMPQERRDLLAAYFEQGGR